MQNPSKDPFSKKEQEWAALILKIARGNESALSVLYEETSRLIYGLAFRVLNNVAEAEEVTIDVYMQVWNNAEQYDPYRSNPSSWLLMLARSRAIDRLRSGAQKKKFEELTEIDFSVSADNPEESMLVAERRKVIEKALSTLDPRQKRAVELAYFYGFSQSEIASKLNQPLGTIKSWLRFGVMKLRDALKENE